MSEQERVRYHEYMRPRASNPTYASSSVGSTIGMLYWHESNNQRAGYGQSHRTSVYQAPQPQTTRNTRQIQPITQKNNSSTFQGSRNQNYPSGQQYRSSNKQPQSNAGNQRRNTPSDYKNINDKRQMNQNYDTSQRLPPSYNVELPGASQSHLSSLGSNSLHKFDRINQRDIYEKQQSRYNIISIQPKEYNETIKKYPKYRLQNTDYNYYKKLQLQNQYGALLAKKTGMGNSGIRNNSNKMPAQSPIPQNYPNYDNGTGNEYETNQPSRNTPANQKHDSRQNTGGYMKHDNPEYLNQPHFRPKFLNNVDELKDII